MIRAQVFPTDIVTHNNENVWFLLLRSSGATAIIIAADDANRLSQIVLIKLMVWLPVTA